MTESDPKVTPAQGTIDRGTRSSRRKVAIFLGVALSCIIGGIVVLAVLPPREEKVAEAAPRAIMVAVHEAVVTNLSEVVIMPGRVEAEKEARLAAETGGRVLWLGVEKGDRVEAGQVLLRLDSRSQTAAVSRAEVNLRQAEDDLKRWQVLKETGSVSALEFEGVLNRRDLARIALDEARTDYERCSVRSPIDGLIEERPVEIGETVMPGVPVLRVVQMDRVKVMVDVPERDVMALPPGAEVCLEADAAPGMTFTGKVAFAAAVADPRSNTFRNEILVENRAGFLKPGMIARVAVVRGVIRNTVVVPLSALIPVKGQYVVYLVEDNRAVRRVVKLRAVIDTLAAVQEGLAPGDRVVVEGQRLVTDGTVVTVAPMILTKYSIKFRVTVFAMVFMLLIAGPVTYFTMPREGSPDVTIPMVFVTAAYEGVAPTEIENLVTIPLEKRFNGLENIKQMTSTSLEGVSLIVIEFTPQQNIDNAVQKVKDKVDLAKRDLPDDLDQPVVQGFNFSTDIPVFTFALSGDSDLERLKHAAEDLRDQVETVPGVLEARLYGIREREIRVEVDLQRLVAYKLAAGEIVGALRGENSTTSAGNIELKGDKFQVRVPGEFTDVRQLADVIVAMREGKPVRLTDVAAIRDDYKDLTSISRVNGEPCVTVAVHKRTGENASGLIHAIKQILNREPLPGAMKLTYVNDQSEMIRLMIEDLENNIVSGFLLVVIILLLFLGVRNSLLVGLAIPFSLMLGFIILQVMGMTLNMLVLFSLVLTVGMLVDNAIVMVENIYRRHGEGESRLEAALNGAAEVAWPVTASTLTTLAAFWPMIYWPGIMGQFMSFLPKTVIVVLSASLFVALVINPALCSVMVGRPTLKALTGRPDRWARFMDIYERLLRGALHHRGLAMAIGLTFLVFSLMVFARFSKGVELFPDVEPRLAIISVSYSEGTDVHTTDVTLRAIEKELSRHKDIRYYLANVGSSGDWALSAASGTHLGAIQMEFVPFGERSGRTSELVDRLRESIGPFPGAEVKVQSEDMGPPTGAAISIEVSGDEFSQLAELSEAIKRSLLTIPGLVDVQDNLEDARPELQFRVDRQRAVLLGLDTAVIGNFLRMAVNGEEAGKFRAGEDEFDITVRLRADQRKSVDVLKQMSITTPSGMSVPLASLGTFVYEGGRGQIMRKDQKRVITITGANQGRGVDKILKDVKARVATVPMPRGYKVDYAGDTREMNDALAFLSKAFLVALALIALILVMEFNSVMQPFIVMVSVVLSMVGVTWGLLLCGMRFGVIMTGIGVVSLAGVVVNNGIVLIDCINQRKAAGLSPEEAIILGGRTRLRPVLLTAISTMAGLIPMAAGWSLEIHTWPPRFVAGAETSAWWAPMAVAVLFGLAVATLLTLIQAPVMYSLAESASESLRRRFKTEEGSKS